MPLSAVGLSFWTASVLPLTVREKQALLSGRSTGDRLLACHRHLTFLSNSSGSGDGGDGGGGAGACSGAGAGAFTTAAYLMWCRAGNR